MADHAIISQHFFNAVKLEFVSMVLYDEYCSFALKRRILLKICPKLEGDIEQKINRLASIRNYFAHIGQGFIEGADSDGNSRVPDPKDFKKSVDFQSLHKEFSGIESLVTKALFEVFQSKGGVIV